MKYPREKIILFTGNESHQIERILIVFPCLSCYPSFVFRMDLVLDILSEMPSKSQQDQISECQELWYRIEDVFSYAMAIAQVCNPCNFKAITGTCQSIISEYENLKFQLTSESSDTALNNLFINSLSDALYRLERKINISVLNLVMEVFSDPFNALRKLVTICGNSLNAKQRSKNDLTDAIEDFDQIIDKSMQIGLFAIASCKDRNRELTFFLIYTRLNFFPYVVEFVYHSRDQSDPK